MRPLSSSVTRAIGVSQVHLVRREISVRVEPVIARHIVLLREVEQLLRLRRDSNDNGYVSGGQRRGGHEAGTSLNGHTNEMGVSVAEEGGVNPLPSW
jgi:hypothetical protein